MATYSYVAVTTAGKEKKGSYEAKDTNEVIAWLKSEGMYPVSVKEAGMLGKDINISFLEKKPSVRDLSVFCRQFVSIVNAGVPVASALGMLSEQTENKMLANSIGECRNAIQAGSSLSEAMSSFPKVFPSLLVTMVAAGEASGSLDISFERMATQFEKDAKIKQTVKKAMTYPLVVLVIALIVVAVLLVFVVPQFESMLNDLGTGLPTITKIVVSMSAFMQKFWYLVLGAIGGIVYTTYLYSKTTAGQYFFSRLQLATPLFKVLGVKTASARMCRTMSTLLSAGVPIIDALDITSNVMTNRIFKDAVINAKDDVVMGTTLSEPLIKSNLFPPMVQHMIKIGEEVGDVEGMMDKTAEYYEEEVENAVAALVGALEPAMIMVLAVIVGFIVLAVMMPMAEMMNGLDNL